MKTSGFLAGAIVGLVAGLLLAPEKGEDLREELAEGAEKWKRKLQKLAGRTGAELDDLRSMLANEVEGLGEDVRHRILTILEEGGETARNIQRNIATELKS